MEPLKIVEENRTISFIPFGVKTMWSTFISITAYC
jgi:hypothetical protein